MKQKSEESGFEGILKLLPSYRDRLAAIREILLANLVMIAEIPAPTSKEEQRTHFLSQRFSEEGLQHPSTDEKGNAVAVLPGQAETSRNILLVAHIDTVFPTTQDHTMAVEPDRITGPGVGDNSLGLAVVVSLPQILNLLNIKLDSTLVLMGAAKSLGRGNLEGLSFFLANNPMPLHAGICVEGMQLGRLNVESVGMLRGEIRCRVPEEYDWTRFGASSAIITLNDVINKLLAIPVPRRPRTAILPGIVRGGSSFNTVATQASLGFEVRSDSAETVREIAGRIEEICVEVASGTRAEVRFDIISRRQPGGIPFTHPLVRRTRSVMNALDIPLRMGPSTSELSCFIERRIPAITVGTSLGDNTNEPNESIRIDPIFSGIAQLLGIIQAIDGGFCDED